MMLDCLSKLIIPKHNQHIVYVHNLSLFDAIFLFVILAELSNTYITRLAVLSLFLVR